MKHLFPFKMIFIIVCLVAIGCSVIVLLTKNDVKMTFPRKTFGTFIENPHVVEDEGVKFVQWLAPIYCKQNGYEVQTVGYASGGQGFWGGRDDATCIPGDGGYRCRGELLDEMLAQPNGWVVQASDTNCPDKKTYVSEAVTF